MRDAAVRQVAGVLFYKMQILTIRVLFLREERRALNLRLWLA